MNFRVGCCYSGASANLLGSALREVNVPVQRGKQTQYFTKLVSEDLCLLGLCLSNDGDAPVKQ